LAKHGERFGTALVRETAVQLGYPVDAVARLIGKCDAIDLAHGKAGKFGLTKYHKVPKASPEDRAKKLMGVKDEPEEDADASG
jgi:hypothetical protein